MNRARLVFAATLVAVGFTAGTALAQVPDPGFKPILAGKKFIPPLRGEAKIDFVSAPTRREGTTIVTRLQVKNTSAAPIARLKVVESWYDKKGEIIPGGEAVVDKLLQPDETASLEIRTPVNLNMAQSKMQFSHNNGTVNPRRVPKLDAPADSKAPAKK